jgi:hypothetical protein
VQPTRATDRADEPLAVSARRCAANRATDAAGIPRWSSDMRPVRGRCLNRVRRKRCPSRWGVIRVSLDFTGDRVDRLATVECAQCGHTWHRATPPPIRSRDGYQTVRLTLILPASARRWFTRGRWHREGSDGIVVRDATLPDVDDAARAFDARVAARMAALDRAREKREAADREATDRARALMAAIHAREAAAAEAEAAAREREAA